MEKTRNPRNAGRKQKGYYQQSLGAEILRSAFPFQGKYLIYGLASSEAPEMIEYIGFTSQALNHRYNHHVSYIKGSTLKERWVREVLAGGHHIIMIALEDGIATRAGACLKEQQYIAAYSAHHRLKNSTKGGLGTFGLVHSEETKRKQSVAIKERKRSLNRRTDSSQHFKQEQQDGRTLNKSNVKE